MKCKKLMWFLCIPFILLFVGSAFAATIQEKSKYANLPGVQHLKQVKPNGDFWYVVKMGTLAPEGVGWASLIKEIVSEIFFVLQCSCLDYPYMIIQTAFLYLNILN